MEIDALLSTSHVNTMIVLSGTSAHGEGASDVEVINSHNNSQDSIDVEQSLAKYKVKTFFSCMDPRCDWSLVMSGVYMACWCVVPEYVHLYEFAVQ